MLIKFHDFFRQKLLEHPVQFDYYFLAKIEGGPNEQKKTNISQLNNELNFAEL